MSVEDVVEERVKKPVVRDGKYFCPGCGVELDSVRKVKKRSKFVYCPQCNARMLAKEFPKDMIILEEEPEDVGGEAEGEEVGDVGERVGAADVEKFLPRVKMPHEVVAEVLEAWRIRQEVINFIVDHIQRVGEQVQPYIIYNILSYGNPGRKLTEMEIMMILSEIDNKLKDEYTKAMAMRLPYPYPLGSLGPMNISPHSITPWLSPSLPTANPSMQLTAISTPNNTAQNTGYQASYSQPPPQLEHRAGDDTARILLKRLRRLEKKVEQNQMFELLKLVMQHNQSLIAAMINNIGRASSQGWSDDIARMITESTSKALDILSKKNPIKEIKDFAKEILAKPVPSQRVGSEEDIYRMLSEAGAETE